MTIIALLYRLFLFEPKCTWPKKYIITLPHSMEHRAGQQWSSLVESISKMHIITLYKLCPTNNDHYFYMSKNEAVQYNALSGRSERLFAHYYVKVAVCPLLGSILQPLCFLTHILHLTLGFYSYKNNVIVQDRPQEIIGIIVFGL